MGFLYENIFAVNYKCAWIEYFNTVHHINTTLCNTQLHVHTHIFISTSVNKSQDREIACGGVGLGKGSEI